MKENEEQALNYAVSVVARYANNGSIYIPELDTRMRGLEGFFVPVYQSKGWPSLGVHAEEQLIGFHVSEHSAKAIEKWLLNDVALMDFVRKMIAFNVKNRYEMPPTLMSLAVEILTGQFEFPKNPAKRPKQTHRDTLLVGVAKRVSEKYDITFNGNIHNFENPKNAPIFGSTISAAALFGFGIVVNHKNVHKICANKSKIHKDLGPTALNAGLDKMTNLLISSDLIDVDFFVSADVLQEALTKAREYW